MQKFCCFPCSETPNIDVDVKCVSACCAGKMVHSLNQKSKQSNESVATIRDNLSEQGCAKTNCGCASFLKRTKSLSKSKSIESIRNESKPKDE